MYQLLQPSMHNHLREIFYLQEEITSVTKSCTPGAEHAATRKIIYQKYPAAMLALLTLGTIVFQETLYAQTADGNNGINQANTLVRSYFDGATQLLFGVAAIVGLIGALRVYNSFNAKDGHTGMLAATWFGGCIFLVIVAAVLRSFFGL